MYSSSSNGLDLGGGIHLPLGIFVLIIIPQFLSRPSPLVPSSAVALSVLIQGWWKKSVPSQTGSAYPSGDPFFVGYTIPGASLSIDQLHLPPLLTL